MQEVRLGIIGGGNMGSAHADYASKIDGCRFAAVADAKQEVRDTLAEKHGVKTFDSGEALVDSDEIDAVLIATPHYTHPPLSKRAFERGIHVLTEKPVAVTAKAAAETDDAYEAAKAKHPGLIYAAMFNQRTIPTWRRVKQLCGDGSIGELIRVQWTITTWFRSQAYYNSGGWRATWEGEGGGVLLNQCPHNLDLFQWFVGMPNKLWTIAGIGKYHDIEVEDDITTMMTFDNGATGTFITSTGQTPGINRLEIVGENGTLIAEGDEIIFREADENIRDFTMNSKEQFGNVAVTEHRIKPPKEAVPQHQAIIANFVDVLLGRDDKLVAPATEGIRGLELGNAMLMAGLTGQPVELPTDREAYDRMLQDLIAKSTFQKAEVTDEGPTSLAGSFA